MILPDIEKSSQALDASFTHKCGLGSHKCGLEGQNGHIMAIMDPSCAIQLAGDAPNGSSPPPYSDTSFGSLGASFMHKCGPDSQKSGLESQIRLQIAILGVIHILPNHF